MSLSQALSTGITGLQTHQRCMDNIGNNLANVNTIGFKKGVYQFATLLEQSMRGSMGADANTGRGSVNPIAMGMGATTASINKVFTQGNMENTNNPLDMAIKGKGFYVVSQGDGNTAYTRAGSFYLGDDGSLMSTAGDGMYVQGTMAIKNNNGGISIPQDAKMQNINIPIGSIGGHSQTSEASFTGNLDSRGGVSYGTRLFGGTSYPTQANMQTWMWTDFNGGDPLKNTKVDTSWPALENASFAISAATMESYGITAAIDLPAGVSNYGDDTVMAFDPADANAACYYAFDKTSKEIISVADANGKPAKVTDLGTLFPNNDLVPLVEEIKAVNGGNVQTSAAYGIQVPTTLSNNGTTVINNHTFPDWFYQSTGAVMTSAQVGAMDFNAMTPAEIDEAIRDIWPNGINGESWPRDKNDQPIPLTLNSIPYPGDYYAASLDTPLEQLQYQKGKTWVQPFATIKNGEAINLSFKKGTSTSSVDFIYHRPAAVSEVPGQVPYDHEKSYTLEHLMKFMAGDVDEPSTVGQNITPEMFGYPNPDWKESEYQAALENTRMATSITNLDTTGGAMGLLSIPPKISEQHFGTDAYDAPFESAGAFSRTDVSQVLYKRMGANGYEEVKGSSFNMSLVSNLGSTNSLSDISITYKNTNHTTMFSAENKYADAASTSSSIITLDFYDSLGNPKTATVHMAMVEQENDFTTWRWYADCPDDTDFKWQADKEGDLTTNLNVGTGLIRFDANGNFVPGCDYSESDGIAINQSDMGVNEPIWIQILNGLASGSMQSLDFSTMTCTATQNSFLLKSQNGNPPGTLEDFTVSLDGVISGLYSNGRKVDIARIGLAMFPNENGLIAAGANLFYTSPASGDARYSHANTGGSGVIVHQQLETSNVDLSEEFTKLISTERGFQANTRTITTADEMITELLNLKR